MKLWEVIKELTEDPTKVATAYLEETGWKVEMRVEHGISGYFEFRVYEGVNPIPVNSGGGFNRNVPLYLDWQLVRQPVTWQEAIQEFAKGKKLNVKFNNQEWT